MVRAVPKPPVRALTLGVAEPHPLDARTVNLAAEKLRRANATFEQAGYEVQTVRLSTRPVLSDLAGWAPDAVAIYAGDLEGALESAGVEFCSLGPARRGTAPDSIAGLADLIAGREALNCSVTVATVGAGVDLAAARGAAEVMLRLAAETKEGFGNFNFAALACVGPGSPFFPAAYHAGPANLTVALQGAGIVAEALQGGVGLADVTRRTRERLVDHATPVVQLAQASAVELGVDFGGIDLSPAPDGDDSIAAAMELAVAGPLGSPWHSRPSRGHHPRHPGHWPTNLWLQRFDAPRHGGRGAGATLGRGPARAGATAGLFGRVRHGAGHGPPPGRFLGRRVDERDLRYGQFGRPVAQTFVRPPPAGARETRRRHDGLLVALPHQHAGKTALNRRARAGRPGQRRPRR